MRASTSFFLGTLFGCVLTVLVGLIGLEARTGKVSEYWSAVQTRIAPEPKNPNYRVADPNPTDKNPVQLGVGARIGKRMFPDDNPWNQDISDAEVDPLSDRIVARIGNDVGLHPDFGSFYKGDPIGIPYVVVDKNQARYPIEFQNREESDPGPYPVPGDAPVEASTDRHVLCLDRDEWKLYELFNAHFDKDTKTWKAVGGCVFDLMTNKLRKRFYTSADAAGLPILPGLVRYDEVMEAKEINHALRFTTLHTRQGFVAPATHWASDKTDLDLPPMGARFRLRKDFDLTGLNAECIVIAKALQKYGMFVADNGGNMFLTGAPDPRWKDANLHQMKARIKARDFQVVKMNRIITDHKQTD